MKRDILPNHPKLQKAINALVASMLAIAGGLAIVCIVDWTDWKFAEPGEYETTLVTEILGTTFLVSLFFIFTAIIAIVLYIRFTKAVSPEIAKTFSPLKGAAKDHEQPIIDLLKSVAQPLPGKTTFNTARVGQFMRALAELGYIDANLDGKYWKPWVEEVTGFAGDTTGHVNAAYKKASIQDEKVVDLCKQLEQTLAE